MKLPCLYLCFVVLMVLVCHGAYAAEIQSSAPIGMEIRMQAYLPDAEYHVRGMQRNDPLMLRIESVKASGENFLYDFRVIALEAGHHNIADYLVDSNGEPVKVPNSIDLTAVGTLPADHNGQLINHDSDQVPFGHYRWLMVGAGILWVALIIPLLLVGRKRKPRVMPDEHLPLPTITQRLNHLINAAQRGELTLDDQAQVEWLLICYWRKKLKLDHLSMDDALAQLRWHVEAGPLFEQLDHWLYKSGRQEMLVPSLLKHCPELAADSPVLLASGSAAPITPTAELGGRQ